jgi:hypothetical protein
LQNGRGSPIHQPVKAFGGQYKIGEIFGEIENKFRSGYSLRDALELIDALRFRSQAEKHELSALYEAKIKNMGNAGRNGGEYYTPRPLIRAMIQVVKPKKKSDTLQRLQRINGIRNKVMHPVKVIVEYEDDYRFARKLLADLEDGSVVNAEAKARQ